MDDKNLRHPVELVFGSQTRTVATVRQAYDLLTMQWPDDARGDRHGDAVGICLKVLDGHRSAIDAEEALKDAVAEAGMAPG